MDVAAFDYELPEELIAQEPAPRRDHARLMVLPLAGGEPQHRRVHELPELMRAGDLLVLNDTRVIAARLRGVRASGGRVELLVLPGRVDSPGDAGTKPGVAVRRCLLRATRRPRAGEPIHLAGGATAAVVQERGGGEALVRFSGADPEALLRRHGEVPLPPYIRRRPGDPRRAADRRRYQTVFARAEGAVAAPTAGLHFTPGLLQSLEQRGAELARLTLHVGPGTFRPVRGPRAEDHVLDPETFVLPESTAAAVARTRERGGAVFACGTTVVRVLESRVAAGGVRAGRGSCELFILPGHRFRVVDGLLTNFHLPRTTLLMLVCAFAGRERVLAAYRTAVQHRYRFYSYGDAMLLTPRAAGPG